MKTQGLETPGLEIKALDIKFPTLNTAEGVIEGPVQYTMHVSFNESDIEVGINQDSYHQLRGHMTGEA